MNAPERISVFLRKDRSDRGKSRSQRRSTPYRSCIKKIYLKANGPDVAAVVEEVRLQVLQKQDQKTAPC